MTGAPEILLESSKTFIDANGNIQLLSSEAKNVPAELTPLVNENCENHELFVAATHRFARKSLRTIMVAFKEMSLEEFEKIKDKTEEIESGLTIISLFGLLDKVRVEVPLSLKVCQKAGIKVIMVTGDNLDTAQAIATECGIIHEDQKQPLNLDQSISVSQANKYTCMTGQ